MRAERTERLDSAHTAQHIACPRCAAPLTLHRSARPEIDACGFESYRLACEDCGAVLGGIVDPMDDAVLLAVLS